MLKDCLEVFKEIYDKKGEELITDSYVLGEGSYVLVDENGEIIEILEVDKKSSDKTGRYYEFAEMDYLSKLVSMDKPVDQKKVIHSNNFMSFFVKKENISNGKLTDDIIENYYMNLSDPRIKYKNSKDKEKRKMYELIEDKYGKADYSLIGKQKTWISKNIFSFLELHNIKGNNNYLKIFFKYDIEQYKQESEKYIVPNIFNSTQFNVEKGKVTYGLSNDNMGLNSKKPYLDNKTRKNPVPYLISTEEVILQKKFFDVLFNNVCEGKTNVYIGNGDIKCLSNEENLVDKFSGYFLRIKKGTEVEILDFDTIVGLNNKISGLCIDTAIHIDYTKFNGELDYGDIEEIKELKMLINSIYFNKFLTNNYFSDPKDIKLNDFRVKENLLKSRGAFFNWFYKGDTTIIKQIFDKTSMELIKNTICNGKGYMIKAKEQFNLRCGILDYFIGGEKMADILTGIASGLREKINSKLTSKIESDNEYYFAVGQVSSYLLSLNKSSKKMHSLINPLLNCKTDQKLKAQLEMLFKKYNYAIKKESKRFNNFSSMVLGYQAESQVNDNMLVAGYLYSSLIYESNKGEEVNDGE